MSSDRRLFQAYLTGVLIVQVLRGIPGTISRAAFLDQLYNTRPGRTPVALTHQQVVGRLSSAVGTVFCGKRWEVASLPLPPLLTDPD